MSRTKKELDTIRATICRILAERHPMTRQAVLAALAEAGLVEDTRHQLDCVTGMIATLVRRGELPADRVSDMPPALVTPPGPIGQLWAAKTEEGAIYYHGRVEGAAVILVRNPDYRAGSGRPQWLVYASDSPPVFRE